MRTTRTRCKELIHSLQLLKDRLTEEQDLDVGFDSVAVSALINKASTLHKSLQHSALLYKCLLLVLK